MDTAYNYSLTNSIKEVFTNAHAWTYTTYYADDRTKMEFLYKGTKPLKPKNIYLDLFGDSTRVLKKNDTIAYYYSKCVNFSVKFDPKMPYDIYGESRSENDSEMPLEILLLKKNKTLYMLILSAKDDGIKIKSGTLFGLLFPQYPGVSLTQAGM